MPRLVLFAAPAGFGKTTLMTQWLGHLQAAARPLVAWLSTEKADADPRHLIADLVVAIRHASGGIGEGTQSLIDGDRQAPIEDLVAHLATELDELAAPLIIVLDDAHLADSPESHEAIGFLLDHLPPRATLAMTTRADPQLPLARMRARGELLEIRAADLRFTGSEASSFLTDVMDLELDRDQVHALETRTEGWPAGLQLAALSARARVAEAGALDAFIADFSGSHRFILDYLLDEVLGAVDGRLRRFLLQTAVLDRLSGPLCDAVTGGDDGQETLEQLERRNLFVIPLDDTRLWYRYHHLFSDALRARLRAETPESQADLHRAAARWHAGQGALTESVRHASAAQDDLLTAYLLEAALPQLRRHRQDQTIVDWVAALPDDVVRASPLLATTRAWAHLTGGEVGQVDEWLTAAEQAVGQVEPGEVPAELPVELPVEIDRERRNEIRMVPSTIAIYRAALAQAFGEIPATIRHATRAAALAGPGDHLAHASAAGFLGLADWVGGELRQARTRFEETKRRLEAAGNVADALSTAVPIGAMTLGLGRPDQALELFEQAITTAEANPGSALASQADLHVGLAGVLREKGELDSAAAHLATAQELGTWASLPENRFRWYAVSADLLHCTGDSAGALEHLARAQELYLPGFFPDIEPLPARRARILVRLGRLEEARDWAVQRGLRPDGAVEFRTEYEHLSYARLLLAEGGTLLPQGLALLDRVIEDAAGASRTGSVIDALVVRALTHRALGRRSAAAEDLSRAITTGAPVGYRRVFLDEGPVLEDLLRAVLKDASVAHAHAGARVVLDSARVGAAIRGAAAIGFRPSSGGEALTERELAVLRLLDSELSGPEIAGHLYVSLNTLRTHTKHIFTKLDVKTRRAAVGRARELGLL